MAKPNKKTVPFSKMVAAGNDFVIIENKLNTINTPLSVKAEQICDRKYGIGADGLLLLEKAEGLDTKMRIFNADGSEAQMCGNGARCAAYYLSLKHKRQHAKLKIKTLAGRILAEVNGKKIKIRLTEPKAMKLNFPVQLGDKHICVNFINTGVPHTVIFVEGLDNIDVDAIGRQVRNNSKFQPAGTNVDFVELTGEDSIKVRTYERGVEGETLACGTGSAAAALIFAFKSGAPDKVTVSTQSREELTVYFKKTKNGFTDVWLEGTAEIVFRGEIPL
ncbi:MAG: diaminopimelate epimerase [Candidatus Omnitrophica bacterium]|nr:diaminopimelate epimerase [Candidatus Omnitrophota bacterium]